MAINENAGPGEGIETPDEETVTGDTGRPDPAGGGCLRLGWGCLPVLIAGLVLVPGGTLLW